MAGPKKRGSAQLQQLILEHLRSRQAAYHAPVASDEIARDLKICPSYAREQARLLVLQGFVRSRRGPSGGYYLQPRLYGSRTQPLEPGDRAAPPPHPGELVACLRELGWTVLSLADELASQLEAASAAPGETPPDWSHALAGVVRVRQAVTELRRCLGWAAGRP